MAGSRRGAKSSSVETIAGVASVISYRKRMTELCPVTAGCAVLDVGCGLGHETIRIAGMAGPSGRVVGIDAREQPLADARGRAEAAGVTVDFTTGDVHALDMADGGFDLCRADRVLLHVDDPAQAMAEMARVTRAGGRVVVYDLDLRALFIDSDFSAMTRRLEALVAEEHRNPGIARELPRLMRAAGLGIEAIEWAPILPTMDMARWVYRGPLEKGVAAGDFSGDEVAAWWAKQESMEAAGTFHHVHGGYIVVGAKG